VQCACQFVVLLAYGSDSAPVVVTAHSSDALAELQVVDDPNAQPDAAAISAVRDALAEAARAWPDASTAAGLSPGAGAEVA
jgi:hypothetical protein